MLAPAYADRCDQTPVDGHYQGLVEAPEGLRHVIKFALNDPEERSFIGTGPEDAPPCSDCEDPISSNGSTPPGSAPKDGGPTTSDSCGAGSSNSSMGSAGSPQGNGSTSDGGCPEAGAGVGIGDPAAGQP